MTHETKRDLKTLGLDLTWLYKPATQKIFSLLNTNTVTTRAVGGAVRNTLLKAEIKDIDFATTATPEHIIQLAEDGGLKVIPTGLEHGTVTIITDINGHKQSFEITTLRQDLETDGRHANIAFTDDWYADASRRDFTINALYLSQDGILFDPVDGYTDLQHRCLRFIGSPELRIQEDYLRILRFFRIQAEYDLHALDHPSLDACVKHRQGLKQLSAERISSELLRLLAAPYAFKCITLMFQHGLIIDVLGNTVRLDHLERYYTICQFLEIAPDSILALTALSTFVREDADRLAKRFKLSRTSHHKLATAAQVTTKENTPPDENNTKKMLYFSGLEDYHTTLLMRWVRSGQAVHDTTWQARFYLANTWSPPTFPVSGSDLLDQGFEPGPELGQMLKKLEKKWVEGEFTLSKPELLDQASNNK